MTWIASDLRPINNFVFIFDFEGMQFRPYNKYVYLQLYCIGMNE